MCGTALFMSFVIDEKDLWNFQGELLSQNVRQEKK